jgi:DNA-binding winged helix-turn-helix (wHTH) protein
MTQRLTFGRFVLDLPRGCLLSDGREIALRPQTFAVLTRLVQRSGEVVSREELLEAAWPGLVVADDTLTQSIDELRRALGDAESRLITTVPGQGYRIDIALAPAERRNAPGLHALRWRWMYGLLAPLVLAIVFAVIWFATSRSREPPPATPPRPASAVDSAMLATHETSLARDLSVAPRRPGFLARAFR